MIHQDKTIFLPDLFRDAGAVADIDFVRCRLVGPIVVFLDPECRFDGETTFILPPKYVNRPPADIVDMHVWRIPMGLVVRAGLAIMTNCLFKDCAFDSVGFAGSGELPARLLEALERPT